jgi:hypothetical protein
METLLISALRQTAVRTLNRTFSVITLQGNILHKSHSIYAISQRPLLHLEYVKVPGVGGGVDDVGGQVAAAVESASAISLPLA